MGSSIHLPVLPESVYIYGVIYTFAAYTRRVKCCDYAVKYTSSGTQQYGLVQQYLQMMGQVFAVIQSFHRSTDNRICQNSIAATAPAQTVIPVSYITTRCCYLDIALPSGTVFFVCPPNKL